MPIIGECVVLISLNLCLSSTIFVCQNAPNHCEWDGRAQPRLKHKGTENRYHASRNSNSEIYTSSNCRLIRGIYTDTNSSKQPDMSVGFTVWRTSRQALCRRECLVQKTVTHVKPKVYTVRQHKSEVLD